MTEHELSIQDLCERTGLPRRTIHFYIQQGLLPPPTGAGPGARYDDCHLLRLRLIPRLRQMGLRLDQIRDRFQDADLPALQAIEQQLGAPPVPNQAPPAVQPYLHYPLPGGILLAAPSNLPIAERKKLAELLEAARRIFAPSPLDPPSKE